MRFDVSQKRHRQNPTTYVRVRGFYSGDGHSAVAPAMIIAPEVSNANVRSSLPKPQKLSYVTKLTPLTSWRIFITRNYYPAFLSTSGGGNGVIKRHAVNAVFGRGWFPLSRVTTATMMRSVFRISPERVALRIIVPPVS
jgi:hypothetical protein